MAKRNPKRTGRKMVELKCRFCGGPSGCRVNVKNPKVHEMDPKATCKACLPD